MQVKTEIIIKKKTHFLNLPHFKVSHRKSYAYHMYIIIHFAFGSGDDRYAVCLSLQVVQCILLSGPVLVFVRFNMFQ